MRWLCIDAVTPDREVMVVVVSVFRNATSNAIQVMWPPALTSCFLANITLHQDVTSLSCCIQIPYTLFFPSEYCTAKHGYRIKDADDPLCKYFQDWDETDYS